MPRLGSINLPRILRGRSSSMGRVGKAYAAHLGFPTAAAQRASGRVARAASTRSNEVAKAYAEHLAGPAAKAASKGSGRFARMSRGGLILGGATGAGYYMGKRSSGRDGLTSQNRGVYNY